MRGDDDDEEYDIESYRESMEISDGSERLNGSDTCATDELDRQERERLEAMTQTRFKHVETEEGHMILTGRDGVLMRCEDEPIHIPGAVQSFGCMVVVREDAEGSLVVRQASENTADILGLTPQHLFSLKCFLDCLDEDQADVLWDAIESLEDREDELLETGPHVFQLSGYGGQVGSGRGKAVPRMQWSCWCAAHRMIRKESDKGSVTILEFEPVKDLRCPLATESPTPTPAEEKTEAESMASTDNEGSGTEASKKELVARIASLDVNGEMVTSVARRGPIGGLEGMPYVPTVEQLEESTKSTSKPIKALSRLRQKEGGTGGKRVRPRRTGGAAGPGMPGATTSTTGDDAMLDMFGILGQINEQFSAEEDLQSFLKLVVSIMHEVTRFSRAMIYQFDEHWNGQVVCELVDIKDTHDLYRGLNFPATDIPKQARDLYRINKVRMLYDRDLNSARMVCREKEDLETPVDMTHSFLRAMSPIHVKYLGNMGVRASMSCSIMAFGQLWGLIAMHTYGAHGRRVSFPIRQLLRLVSESVSRNIERLSYTKRLQSRKLINTLPTAGAPTGYILTKAEELLELFDADVGVIAIGAECKILGNVSATQEVLALTEYLRLKSYTNIVSTTRVARDFPDMVLPDGLDLDLLAGVLVIPLSEGGKDFIVFTRRAQARTVSWAGKPFKQGSEGKATLEPRKSFKLWSETVTGTCRAWKDEELETAGVLCLVYGKFITVWRSREAAMQYNQLNRLLLSNASHEVRTPLHHLVNYLELALDGPLDEETRENLNLGRIASKSLLFTINDLLDISRAEEGKQLFLQEPFDLAETCREAVEMHEWDAKRRDINFKVKTKPATCVVLGDRNRMRQVLINTTSNSLKHTEAGGNVFVEMKQRRGDQASINMPEGCDTEIELSISDTGSGIPRDKLEAIFREFEQVEAVVTTSDEAGARHNDSNFGFLGAEGNQPDVSQNTSGLGVGLAVVARIIRNLNGQLRVDSTVGVGSRFVYLIPMKTAKASEIASPEARNALHSSHAMRRNSSQGSLDSSGNSQLNSLVEAIGAPVTRHRTTSERSVRFKSSPTEEKEDPTSTSGPSTLNAMPVRSIAAQQRGIRDVVGSNVPLRPTKIDPHEMENSYQGGNHESVSPRSQSTKPKRIALAHRASYCSETSRSEGSRRSFVSALGSQSADSVKDRRIEAVRQNSTASRSAKAKVAPLRILVVEDDPINRKVIKKRLGMDGHTMLEAVNGEEGVLAFERDGGEMDVILMDLQMPICNGQDACKRIRAIEDKRRQGKEGSSPSNSLPSSHLRNGRIPIFAVSATLTPEMRQEMVQIGMDGFILKPVDFTRLNLLLQGITDLDKRKGEMWTASKSWEKGGWLVSAPTSPMSTPAS